MKTAQLIAQYEFCVRVRRGQSNKKLRLKQIFKTVYPTTAYIFLFVCRYRIKIKAETSNNYVKIALVITNAYFFL